MTVKNFRSPSPTAIAKFARLDAAFIALCLLTACGHAQKQPGAQPPQLAASSSNEYSASLLSTHVVDGSLVVVDVRFKEPQRAEAVKAEFEKKKFSLYPVDDRHYQGLFGVPHSHVPGPSSVTIMPEGADATVVKFEIADAHYPSETLKVDNRKVNPHKKDMIRIRKELAEVGVLYGLETTPRLWNGAFIHPTNTVITDQFGMKRLYNGQLRSYHGGMDFRAAIGTPIHASATGRVVLAKNLFFSGNTVILDHGYGLLTMYFHMSKIVAKKGQLVAPGDLLGLSGKTGRVTGPHLHFQVVVHGTKVNPMGLFEDLK